MHYSVLTAISVVKSHLIWNSVLTSLFFCDISILNSTEQLSCRMSFNLSLSDVSSQIWVTRFWQKYYKSDAVTFSIDHIRSHMIPISDFLFYIIYSFIHLLSICLPNQKVVSIGGGAENFQSY